MLLANFYDNEGIVVFYESPLMHFLIRIISSYRRKCM